MRRDCSLAESNVADHLLEHGNKRRVGVEGRVGCREPPVQSASRDAQLNSSLVPSRSRPLRPMRTVVSGSSGCNSLAVYSPNASLLSLTRTCWPTARPIVASRAASTERCLRRSCRSRW